MRLTSQTGWTNFLFADSITRWCKFCIRVVSHLVPPFCIRFCSGQFGRYGFPMLGLERRSESLRQLKSGTLEADDKAAEEGEDWSGGSIDWDKVRIHVQIKEWSWAWVMQTMILIGRDICRNYFFRERFWFNWIDLMEIGACILLYILHSIGKQSIFR